MTRARKLSGIVGLAAALSSAVWIAAAVGARPHYFTNTFAIGLTRHWMVVAIAPNGSGGEPKPGWYTEEPLANHVGRQFWWVDDLDVRNWRFLPVPHLFANFVLWMVFFLLYFAARRRRAGHCHACDYDLTGNESGICPECGAAVEATA